MIQIDNHIIADEGYIFIRKIDNFEMGTDIYLGIDWSTGEPREDKPEYYKEIKIIVEE